MRGAAARNLLKAWLLVGLLAAAFGGLALELPGLARLHVVAPAPDLLEDAFLHDFALEGLQRPVDAVAFGERDLDHVVS